MNKWIGLLLLLAFSCSIWAKQTLKISTSDWPPFIVKESTDHGYISQIVKESFEQVGINVEFIFVPWARAYEQAKSGDVDATSYWYKDDKHAEHFILSAPISTEKVVFFRLKSEEPLIWRSLADFDHKVLGLTRGYTYTKAFWEYADQHQDRVSIVGTDKQNLKMLLLGRIDVTPAQDVVGWYLLQNMFAKEQINRVEMMQPPLSVRTGHLLFPKDKPGSKTLVELFNKGLAILEKNGRLEELNEALIFGNYAQKQDR